MMHVAGTDSARHHAFVEQALDFAAAWRAHLHERLFLDRMLTPEDVAGLPRFQFIEPRGDARIAWVAAFLALLGVLLACLLRHEFRTEELR
jgi:hypothetical protein